MDVKELKAQLEYKNKNVFDVISEDELEFYAELTPHSIENFYKEAKNTRNVIIQAHPYRDGVTLAPVSAIDGIEAYNLHPNHNQRNALTVQHAKRNDLLEQEEVRWKNVYIKTKLQLWKSPIYRI